MEIVLPVIEVFVTDGVAGGGTGASARRPMAVSCGGPAVFKQLLSWKTLLEIVVPSIMSPGALAWTITPGRPLPMIVLPVMVLAIIGTPGASAATTIWPISGPCGPNFPIWDRSEMWLPLAVMLLAPPRA